MKSHIGPLILILLAFGCEKPSPYAQQGRYCESGAGSGMYGRVHIMAVRGNKLGPTGAIVGPVEHVLYVAISLPGPQTGAGGHSEAGITRSSWTWTFSLVSGAAVLVDIEWDRVTDVVTLAGRRFDRGAGNVFLIEVDGKGTLIPRQNSKVRTELLPDGEEARVIEEEFPHLAPALR